LDEELNGRSYTVIKFPIVRGNKTFVAGYGIDITERKRAEEEKEKLQAQLLQAQKMESIGRLAGGVAHDFNNMLGVILGHAEMALEQVDPTQLLYSDLQAIRKAAHHSTELTRQLLAFARKQTISPKVLNLNEIVGGMLKMLKRLIGEDISLGWLPAGELWPVKVDPSQIDQILANLCVNARDAIAGVGKVTIETGNISFDEIYCATRTGCVPGNYVLLAVSDDGCGMDKETLGKLFEPFFTTKEMGKGTGLGLAMVYGIVKQNNGFIDVYSEPGQGTTFRIYLPRHLGKAEQPRIEGSQEQAVQGQETLLVVEDEPEILSLAKRMLEKQGYQVLAAGTPGEAIRLAEEHAGEIDLLMTDVVMPEMNGRDLAKKMLSLYPDIKRLFMSGYTADVIAHHGVLDDGVYFIQKPFSAKDLTAKVREALDQK
jgi:signal transduction histidine kinase/ActR/RegA family two-component response regulator